MATLDLVFFLVAAALSFPASATPIGSVFTCSNSNSTFCTGSLACAYYKALVCSALGDLYYATNGAGWINNTGWSSAAAGTPTDYCSFYSGGTNYSGAKSTGAATVCPSQGPGGVPLYLCVALILRAWARPDSLVVT